MNPLMQILRDAYENNYQGNIAELMRQHIASTTEVAMTPEEQQTGLTEGPPRQMVFPDVNGTPFNTREMDYPIDMQGYDEKGNLVRSYEKVPPGLVNINMEGASTVIEQPSMFKDGGRFELPSERLKRYRPGSTLKKK